MAQLIYTGIASLDGYVADSSGNFDWSAPDEEVHAFVNDPTNDAVTLPIYQRLTTPDAPELAIRGLNYTRRLGMWPEGLRVSPRAFDSTVEVMVEAGLLPPDQREAAAGVLDTRFTLSADH